MISSITSSVFSELDPMKSSYIRLLRVLLVGPVTWVASGTGSNWALAAPMVG